MAMIIPTIIGCLLASKIYFVGVNKLLISAANAGDAGYCEVLITLGANANAYELLFSYGKEIKLYVLPNIIGKDYMDVAHVLLKHGADPNTINNGITSLSGAADHNDAGMVRELLEHGADVNGITFGSETPLFRATSNKEITQILIEAGADVNIVNSMRQTALSRACSGNNPEVIKMLVDKGANCNNRDSDGNYPITLLCAFWSSRTVHIQNMRHNRIQEKQEADTERLQQLTGLINSLKSLLAHGANVNARDLGGRTPIMIAVHQPSEVVKFLIINGADVHLKDNKGITALAEATRLHLMNTSKLLREAGAKE